MYFGILQYWMLLGNRLVCSSLFMYSLTHPLTHSVIHFLTWFTYPFNQFSIGTLTASTEEIKSSSKHVDLKLDTRFCSTEVNIKSHFLAVTCPDLVNCHCQLLPLFFSLQLLDHFLAMLNASDLLRTSCSEPNELSIIQSSVRILLACLENSDPDVRECRFYYQFIPTVFGLHIFFIFFHSFLIQYYVVASTRLHTVVQSKCLPSHDIHFILYHLALILENTIIDNGTLL